ncbi:MAG: hypothetical protein KF780_00915 [Sphingomonas sp.]|nr:hypothetical protein [Sphingomonas sp.]
MLFLCLCYFDRDAPVDRDTGRHAPSGRDRANAVIIEGQIGESGLSLTVGGSRAARREDGLPAEGEARVGAFLLVHAETIDEAAEVALKHPPLGYRRHGAGIEIQPIDTYEIPGRPPAPACLAPDELERIVPTAF